MSEFDFDLFVHTVPAPAEYGSRMAAALAQG